MIQDPEYMKKSEVKCDRNEESLGNKISLPELGMLSHVSDSLHIPAAAEQMDSHPSHSRPSHSHPNPGPRSSFEGFEKKKDEKEMEESGKDIKDMMDPVTNVFKRHENQKEFDQRVGEKDADYKFVFPEQLLVYQPGDFAWMLLRQKVGGSKSPGDLEGEKSEQDPMDESEEEEYDRASGFKNFLWPCVIVAVRELSELARNTINKEKIVEKDDDDFEESDDIGEIGIKRRKVDEQDAGLKEEIESESKMLNSSCFGISQLALQVHERLNLFQLDRWECLIKPLPLPSSFKVDSTGTWPEHCKALQTITSNINVDFFYPDSILPEHLVIPDYFLVPFKYTTEPTLPAIENSRLTRALIQAVFIQSSWSEDRHLTTCAKSKPIDYVYIESSRSDLKDNVLRNIRSQKSQKEPNNDFVEKEMNQIANSWKNLEKNVNEPSMKMKEPVEESEIQNQRTNNTSTKGLLNKKPTNSCNSKFVKLDSSILNPITIPDPVLPDWRKPIQMSCPTIRGLYYNAKIYQNMIEPKIVNRINSGIGVVDLTDQLYQQGISHWKNTKGRISFFLAKNVSKLPSCPPFPTEAEIERVRLGPLMIHKGDYLVIGGNSIARDIIHVQEICAPKGTLSFTGTSMNGKGRVTFQADLVKGRFTGCFDEPTRECKIYERCDWNGEKLFGRERMMNTK